MASLSGSGGKRAADPPKAAAQVCRLHAWYVHPARQQNLLEEELRHTY